MADAENTQRKAKGLGPLRIFIAGVMLLTAAALAVGGVGLGGYAYMGYRFHADGPHENDVIVLIPRGSSVNAIIEILYYNDVMDCCNFDPEIFRLKTRLDGGAGDLRAGEFLIPAGASMADIYDILRFGPIVQHPITAAEGLTSAMIVRIVEAAEVLNGDIEAVPPEGSLLPETYMVERGTDRQAVIDRMAAAQSALLDALWPARAEDLPFETREAAIILASIVEKETGVAAERPLVASVFINRLRRGMRLESDPTIIYGITQGEPLGRGIRRSELDDASNPYNTYEIDGLPPTPIANPGRDAIAAVLNPPDTEYLFFVADGTGGHAFAETYAEHRRNVAAWRRIEAERAAAGGD